MATFSRDPIAERSLKHSLKDAGAYAVMTGAGETYLSAYALFLKATTTQIGLLASLPPMLASLVQLLSAWLGHLTGRRKLIILLGAGIQAAAWLPILVLPILFPEHAVPLLIISVIVYYGGANLAAPQWSSLMGEIVPERRRGRFFALRTRLVTATTFLALLIAGFSLHSFSRAEATRWGFITLFAIAGLARLISVYHLSRMQDPYGHVAAMELPIGRDWWRRLRESNAVRFSIFFALMQFSVAISSPFFTVYMLRDLEYTYFQFTLNTAVAILAQFLTLAQWGRISDVFGNRRILSVTGLFIPLLPIMWTFSSNFWYLLGMQALSGFSWAGFTLSAGNFLYDMIAPQRRATYLSIHNVLASTGVFGGALLGGYLGTVMPTAITLGSVTWTWLSPLYGVFIISTLARATAVLMFVPRLKEVRAVRPISMSQVIFRVMRINALAGVVFEILGSQPRRKPQDRG